LNTEAALTKYGREYHPFRDNEFYPAYVAMLSASASSTSVSAIGSATGSSVAPAVTARSSSAVVFVNSAPAAALADDRPASAPAAVPSAYSGKARKRVRFELPPAFEEPSASTAGSLGVHRTRKASARRGWKGWVALDDTEVLPVDKLVTAHTVFETRRTRSGLVRP
jgi:hypothetical protein